LLLFSIAVAGKTAATVARAIHNFMGGRFSPPFSFIRCLSDEELLRRLKKCRLGNYTRLAKAFRQLANARLDLKNITVSELEKIHGVGPKTARMFLLHTRPNQKLAVLDVHVLRFMREEFGWKVPKVTPSGKAYAKIERDWLNFCSMAAEMNRGLADGFKQFVGNTGKTVSLTYLADGSLDIAAFDLAIWNAYKKGNSEQVKCAYCKHYYDKLEISCRGRCFACEEGHS
jgi:thermostable 8-oxoguanine DNA glycosylase